MTNPVETIAGMVEGVKEDPWSLLISSQAREAWADGDYGEAIGRGLWEGGSLFLPGIGWVGKGSRLSGFGGDGNSGGGGNNGDSGNNSGEGDSGGDSGDGSGSNRDDEDSTERADESTPCPTGNCVPDNAREIADQVASGSADRIFVKNKHLRSFQGRYAKFDSDDIAEVRGWVQEAMRSENAEFKPNGIEGTFKMEVDMGRPVGTKGQQGIRIIVSEDGRVINTFPYNP